MSYSRGGKTLSSTSRTCHESIAPDDSGTASLSSQLNLYNSELATSSSQPHDNNSIYRNDGRYSMSNNYSSNDSKQQLQYQQEQMRTPVRSSPIAIIRAPGDTKKEPDQSDTDDDDSVIDVEGDAIKLRRKYGNKIIQTCIQESTIIKSSHARIKDKSSVLNAPYLGSLSKSSNQVLSLPPISLAGDSTYLGEPPESILSYGSLRDSHERGRFLDGPSSYREAMSGKIRQLDHRLRYHGRQPELNIGERLQRSRKLKELRLKEESKNKGGLNGNANAENSNRGEVKERKETKSSLSAIMRDVLHVNTTGADINDSQQDSSILSSERLVPIQRENAISTQSHENRFSIHPSPRNMLSTSLTAFELLKSSNTDNILGGNTPNPCHSVTRVTDTNQKLDLKKSSGFQPLARSMSDPSPRFQNVPLSEISSSTISPAVQTENLVTQFENALADTRKLGNHAQLHQGTQYKSNCKLGNNTDIMLDENVTTASTSLVFDHAFMFISGGPRSPHLDHDPNTDGAFGDLDM